MGRATQGVTLINLEKRNDEIASVCKVMSEEEVEEIQDAENVEVDALEAPEDNIPEQPETESEDNIQE